MKQLLMVFMLVTPVSAGPQRVQLEALDALAERAESTTQVDLASDLLEFAMPFLGEGSDEGLARDLIANLEGVYVRVFQDLTYSGEELDAVRSQLVASQWTRLVSIDEDDEEIGVWLHRTSDDVTGMFVLVAEQDEIVAVNIVGSLNPEDLAALGARFGVPVLNMLQ